MPKRGIHPLVHSAKLVLRNGASINIQSVYKFANPIRLQVDPTNHPIWTGEKSGMSLEDERISKVMKRYGAFLGEAGKAK